MQPAEGVSELKIKFQDLHSFGAMVVVVVVVAGKVHQYHTLAPIFK